MLDFARTRSRNQFREGFAPEAGKREVDNIGIAEKIKKEGLYRSQRIRPAKLK
jgi:hypothetical protein